MQLLKFAPFLAAAATAVLAENIITLTSVDDLDRTVYFTANAGLEAIDPVEVAAGQAVDVQIPYGWVGNYFSVTKGAPHKPGMLGEVNFNGWNGFTYFDVSAIVDPNDLEGVSEMWPAKSGHPSSGCAVFPCGNAYYLPDDVQTKVTPETHLISTLGKSGFGGASRLSASNAFSSRDDEDDEESHNFKRSFVEGNF